MSEWLYLFGAVAAGVLVVLALIAIWKDEP